MKYFILIFCFSYLVLEFEKDNKTIYLILIYLMLFWYRYDMEMHMVHLNENATNKIVVIGVLYKIGKPDRFLSKVNLFIYNFNIIIVIVLYGILFRCIFKFKYLNLNDDK